MHGNFHLTPATPSNAEVSDGELLGSAFLPGESRPAETSPALASRHHWPAVLAMWTLLLILVAGWNTLKITEPIDGDAIGFLPQILHFKQDGQLVNEIYAQGFAYTPARDGRYVWHGLLFPLLTGKLAPRADYEAVMLVIFAYQALTLAAVGIALLNIRPSSWLEMCALLTAPAVINCWQLGIFGRPEVMVIMWIAIGLAVFMRARRDVQPWIAGITIGLVAATSPIPGALLGLSYSAYAALRGSWRDCLSRSLLAATLALGIFFAVFVFSPYTIAEWMQGTLLHARDSVVGYERQPFVKAWLLKEDRPLIAVWTGAFVFSTLLFFHRSRREDTRWNAGFAVLGLLVVALAAYTSPDMRNYNIAALAPIILVSFHIVVWRAMERLAPWKQRLALSIAILFGAAASLPLLRQALIKFHVQHGLSREEGAAILEQLRAPNVNVALSNGLFVLSENTRGIVALNDQTYLNRDTIDSNADVVLIQQINPYKAEPPRYRNYELVKSYFVSYVPKILGIPLARSPRAFNFAVYQKSRVSPNETTLAQNHP